MVNVNINLGKKDLFLISGIVVLFVAVGYVIAYNSDWQSTPGTPSIMGHSLDEIMPCAESQTLRVIGGKWSCEGDLVCTSHTVQYEFSQPIGTYVYSVNSCPNPAYTAKYGNCYSAYININDSYVQPASNGWHCGGTITQTTRQNRISSTVTCCDM